VQPLGTHSAARDVHCPRGNRRERRCPATQRRRTPRATRPPQLRWAPGAGQPVGGSPPPLLPPPVRGEEQPPRAPPADLHQDDLRVGRDPGQAAGEHCRPQPAAQRQRRESGGDERGLVHHPDADVVVAEPATRESGRGWGTAVLRPGGDRRGRERRRPPRGSARHASARDDAAGVEVRGSNGWPGSPAKRSSGVRRTSSTISSRSRR
jgi:hypothetical protein